ncbi:glycosyltransferase family 61 protein [Paenibacillus sp. MBLB4367]|uniref:glycosyltransferase family 61 protein n=1 Tax=Paenibacillus sp. MBLB4367 TaxID=3384767 RepID=UPI003908298D
MNPPKGIDEQLHAVFRLKQFYSPAPYVAEIPNGRVWGDYGAVITPDNILLWDVSIFPPMIPSEHHIFRQPALPPLQHTDETIGVLTFCASGMYYHWMFDAISRLDLLNQSGIPIDRYIVNGDRCPFQAETLELLGIPKEKQLHCYDTFHLQSRRLIVPVAPAIDWGPHLWQIQYLRKELLISRGTAPAAEYEKIFISRSLASNRRVTNEEQLFEILRPLGFKLVHLELYSVVQQAQVFSSAKLIVSPHGSGLTNLIFCRPGTKVVELFAPSFPVYVFWLICNQLELDYYYLFGEGERAPDKVDPAHGFDDIEIDIEKFKSVLELAGIYTDN